MLKHRPATDLKLLTNGPAKLCEALKIDRSLDGIDLYRKDSPLFIARNSALKTFVKERGPIITTTRIGITKAAELPLRFYLGGSSWVSRPAARMTAARSA